MPMPLNVEKITLKYPDIPRNVSSELYNYFIQLQQSLEALEAAVNKNTEAVVRALSEGK